MSDPEPKVGDEVAWNWGSFHIEGEVVEKTDKKITKQIKGKPKANHQKWREGQPSLLCKANTEERYRQKSPEILSFD